jgi:hypothetical protein
MRRGLALLAVIALGCEVDPFCIDDCGGDGGVASLDGASVGEGGVGEGGVDGDAGPDGGPCVPAPDPTELCNGVDDDCNGNIDEGFDLSTDRLNCGECGTQCLFLNGDGDCQSGECVLLGCLEGFEDFDEDPGCEYACPVFPAQPEECNGLDDDCDGTIDEPEDLPPPPTDLCRNVPGTPCAGVVPVCATREGRSTWFCAYPTEVEFDPVVPNGIVLEETLCDGFDGDCDGVADDPFETLGDACDNGEVGACQDAGLVACDPADPTTTACDFSLGADPVPGAGPGAPELCNGVDDDCDGTVDDSDPMDSNRVLDDMVRVQHSGLDFWIYRHEASRPDATDAAEGTAAARACGRSGVLPWTGVGFAEAEAACVAAGHRLCTAAEWLAACEGEVGNAYPYGAVYDGTSCNGADYAPASPGVEATGALAACVSADGVFDLSGNLKEWTDDQRGSSGAGTPIHVVRGGSFESPEFGLTCGTDLSRAEADTLLPSFGFRCCDDGGP